MLMKCNANISILGAMRNANVMQIKCNSNKCEKMHNSVNDPLPPHTHLTLENQRVSFIFLFCFAKHYLLTNMLFLFS